MRGQAAVLERARPPDPMYLIIRRDDAGLSHSINLALRRLGDAALPLAESVMFPPPWYREAVEMAEGEETRRADRSSAPGVHVVVAQVGMDDPELGAVEDTNANWSLSEMSTNRQGELDALTSSRFTEALGAGWS
jgi:hypothetical protein